MSKELIDRIRELQAKDWASPNEVEAADRIMELERELEREQMRLVACGVVAMCDTPESAEKARQMHPDYESASCSDVARRVDECIELRKRIEEQQSWIASLEAHARDADRMYKELETELAASQAQIKVLREALYRCALFKLQPSTIQLVVNNALAKPTDDSALREMLAQERERCAKVIEKQDVDPSFKHRMADAIRAMGSES